MMDEKKQELIAFLNAKLSTVDGAREVLTGLKSGLEFYLKGNGFDGFTEDDVRLLARTGEIDTSILEQACNGCPDDDHAH